MITIYQIKDVEKILAEDGYEIVINEKTLAPMIYKKSDRRMGVRFFMGDFLNNNNNVGEAAQYLKQLYNDSEIH